jgi:hypothetical protein
MKEQRKCLQDTFKVLPTSKQVIIIQSQTNCKSLPYFRKFTRNAVEVVGN